MNGNNLKKLVLKIIFLLFIWEDTKEEKEILIPFVFGSVILDVNLSESKIKVDWQWD